MLCWVYPAGVSPPTSLAEHPRPLAGETSLMPTEEASLPLAVTKEAKVSSPAEELQEDQLGEDDLARLETL